jgi:hypothetical protein
MDELLRILRTLWCSPAGPVVPALAGPEIPSEDAGKTRRMCKIPVPDASRSTLAAIRRCEPALRELQRTMRSNFSFFRYALNPVGLQDITLASIIAKTVARHSSREGSSPTKSTDSIKATFPASWGQHEWGAGNYGYCTPERKNLTLDATHSVGKLETPKSPVRSSSPLQAQRSDPCIDAAQQPCIPRLSIKIRASGCSLSCIGWQVFRLY